MFDVITFGSATRDMFVLSKDFKILDCGEFITGKGLCVPSGSKVYLEDVVFATGGGGTNAAATFANQGFKTAYVGKVGGDTGGQAIIEELKNLKVNTGFIVKADKLKTAYSVILSLPGAERTILVYRGACQDLNKNDISWRELKKTKWFYISGLSGKSAEIFEPIIDFAAENGIKIAVNPGESQIKMNLDRLQKILNKIDIFILNKEEATKLTCLPWNAEKEIFKQLDAWIKGIAVMTKGPDGVMVSDGREIYSAGIPKSKIIDRTGAGDAFGSGFVAGLMQAEEKLKSEQIIHAIQLGTANATSTVQRFGAKNGLLKKGNWGEWKKVEVKSYRI
ncbi:MAG: carbohydrate kinase family protein [Candidatus Portnoybacteria bacterium]|nr:carbohydrate kinase family protein [Candidatus Portnoybacteria bacterium]